MNPAPFEAKAGDLENGVRTISVRGELDLSTAPELEGPLDQAVESGEGSVLIDLTQCEFIDSTGIAVIVRSWQRLDKEGEAGGRGRLVLCCDNTQVMRLLRITGVESSIAVHAEREEALAELGGGAPAGA